MVHFRFFTSLDFPAPIDFGARVTRTRTPAAARGTRPAGPGGPGTPSQSPSRPCHRDGQGHWQSYLRPLNVSRLVQTVTSIIADVFVGHGRVTPGVPLSSAEAAAAAAQATARKWRVLVTEVKPGLQSRAAAKP
jgi:hypothetical protein